MALQSFDDHRHSAGILIEDHIKFLRADGLGQIAIHAAGEAKLLIALHGVRGQRDDGLMSASALPRPVVRGLALRDSGQPPQKLI